MIPVLIMRALNRLPLSLKIGLPVLIALLIWILLLMVQLNKERWMRDQLSVEHDLRMAAADTTRLLMLRDLDEVWQRRSFQERQRQDSIDRALGLERRARVNMALHFDSLLARATAPVIVLDSGVRQATFRIDSTPLHGTILATLAPSRATVEVSLALDSVALDVRLSCGAPPLGSVIRPATVTVIGSPAWATIGLRRVEQDPVLCNAERDKERGEKRKGILPFYFNIGACATWTFEGKVRPGICATIGPGFRVH